MKAFLKRFSCLALALVLMVCLLPDVTPKAQAITADETVKAAEEVVKAFSQVNKADMRMIYAQIDLIGAKVALETKITAGALTGVALAQAKVILLEIQTKINAIGIKPATCAKFFKYAVVAGIVIEITDWQNVWDAVFDRETFFEERYVTMATPLHSAVVNYTNLDEQFTNLVHRLDKMFFSDGSLTSDFDYVECTNEGWKIITNGFKDFFGITADTPSGKTQTQPIGLFQAFDLSGAELVSSTVNGANERYRYVVPVGWTFVHPDNGYYIGQSVHDGYKMPYGVIHDYYRTKEYRVGFIDDLSFYFNIGVQKKGYDYVLTIDVFIKENNVAINLIYFDICEIDSKGNYIPIASGGTEILHFKEMPKGVLETPSIPIINNYPDLKNEIDKAVVDNDPDKPLVFPLPPYNPDPNKTDEENMVDYIGTFPQTPVIPQVGGDPATDPNNPTDPNPTPQPTPKPDTETETEPDPEQTKKKLDFSPLLSFTGLAEVFPFCLPFDFIRMVKTFNAPRKAPIFTMKLPLVKGHVYETVVDLTPIASIMPLIRSFLLLSFAFALIFNTSKVIKW